MDGEVATINERKRHDAMVQRMLQEAKELNIRIMAATAFVSSNPEFPKLSNLDQQLLYAQTAAMQSYFNLLTIRIERAQD